MVGCIFVTDDSFERLHDAGLKSCFQNFIFYELISGLIFKVSFFLLVSPFNLWYEI
jgi:hypothetical protein